MADIAVPVNDLQIGHYVKLPLSWKDHPFLFSAFRIKDEEQLRIIRGIGLREFVVDPERSTTPIVITPPPAPVVVEPPPPSAEEIAYAQQREQQLQLRRGIRTAERAFGNSVTPLRDAMSQLNMKPDEGLGNVAELVRQAGSFLSQQEGPVGLHLIRLPAPGDPLLLHSLNVAFISMLVAREAGWEPLDIEDAGLAGLVHDIGELKVPSTILRKRTELTPPEVNYLRMHVRYGFDQLTQLNAFTPRIRKVVLQHHERLDGSGYPDGIKDEALDPLAKLVMVIDAYDTSLHPREMTRPVLPNQVITDLFKRAGKQLDATFIKLLIKVIGIYPPGSLVELSDGSLALVMSSHPSTPLKPCVLPWAKGIVPEGVDLVNLNQDARTIRRVVDIDEINPQQREFFGLGNRYCYYFTTSLDEPISAPTTPATASAAK